MSTFKYQKWKKKESEQRIINALSDGDKGYSELLDVTYLSKPILSERLKSLEKHGKIESVPEKKTKRFLYHIVHEDLDAVEKALVLLHKFYKYTLDCLEEFAKDTSISDEEYANNLLDGIQTLFTFRIFETIVAPSSVQEERLTAIFGLEFVKRMPKLFPEHRNVLPFVLNGISPKEQAIYKTEKVKTAANQLLEYLNTMANELARVRT